MTRILAIDDEPAILRAITIALGAHGHEVRVAASARAAIATASDTPLDLLLVDLGLPDASGLDVIRHVRTLNPTIPILVLSAMDQLDAKIQAFDLGADDYVTKPFAMPELIARIRVALRHAHEAHARPSRPEDAIIEAGPVRIDLASRHVTVHGKPVALTPTQYELLRMFARHPDRVLTHSTITTAAWGPSEQVDAQTLRVAISQLRKRIETDPTDPKLIRTELGIGYRYQPNDDT
jgi:two-component system KDP operon response regulator KdpE